MEKQVQRHGAGAWCNGRLAGVAARGDGSCTREAAAQAHRQGACSPAHSPLLPAEQLAQAVRGHGRVWGLGCCRVGALELGRRGALLCHALRLFQVAYHGLRAGSFCCSDHGWAAFKRDGLHSAAVPVEQTVHPLRVIGQWLQACRAALRVFARASSAAWARTGCRTACKRRRGIH